MEKNNNEIARETMAQKSTPYPEDNNPNQQNTVNTAKVDAISAAFEKIDAALTHLIDGLKLAYPKRSLSQIANMCSATIDALIIREEIQHQYRYIGGEFTITYINEAAFKLNIALYFKDMEDQWIEVSSVSQPRDMQYLTKEAIAELRANQKISFEIDAPKRR